MAALLTTPWTPAAATAAVSACPLLHAPGLSPLATTMDCGGRELLELGCLVYLDGWADRTLHRLHGIAW